jgi:GAF domain-containing protein
MPGLLTGFASSATGTKGTRHADRPWNAGQEHRQPGRLDPTRDLAATLQRAVDAAKSLFEADAGGIMLADLDGRLRWASASDQRAQTLEDNHEVFAAGSCKQAFTTGKPAAMHDAALERRRGEIALVFVDVQIRSALSVTVELVGGPIGTLDVYGAQPRGWDDSEVTALQTHAGVVASLLAAAAKAELKGALADQLQTVPDSRAIIERGKGALMERGANAWTSRRPSPTCAGRPGPRAAS